MLSYKKHVKLLFYALDFNLMLKCYKISVMGSGYFFYN